MNKTIISLFFSLILCFVMVFPVLAQEEKVVLESPINITSVPNLVTRVLEVVLGLTGVIALVMFIYGGILWMTSAGRPEQVKKGKETLLWAAVGLAFIFFSYSLLQFLLETLIQVT